MSAAETRKLAYLLVGLLGLVIIVCLGAQLVTLPALVLKNYNEGWNAYHAMAAMRDPALLYPASTSLLTNNYPPLSFVITGALWFVTGDAIIAGRLLAFVSTLGIGICLAFCARICGCRWRHAMVAALVFGAAPWVIVRFSALNDPQALGNFLSAIGLVFILRGPRNLKTLALGALFLTLAEFVKPLFITLPAALLIWLFVVHRRSALLLAAFGLGFAILGYGLTALVFHTELLGHLFSPRVFLWSKLTGQPGQWLVVMALPFAASLALLKQPDDKNRFGLFAGLYAALAFVLAVIFSGGDGVSASQMMDVSMASALGAALYLQRAENRRFTPAGLGLGALTLGVMLALSFAGLWASRPSLPELMGSRTVTAHDIGLVAQQPGPVLCETLALCYWAGKKPQVDAFGFHQAVLQGRRNPQDLTRFLDARAFSLIQLQPRSVFETSPVVQDAIARNYQLEHQDKNGLFLIPRGQAPR